MNLKNKLCVFFCLSSTVGGVVRDKNLYHVLRNKSFSSSYFMHFNTRLVFGMLAVSPNDRLPPSWPGFVKPFKITDFHFFPYLAANGHLSHTN